MILHNRCRNQENVIYACTHIGGNDIQRCFEAVQDHAYLLLGDPCGLYKSFTGGILFLNGVICLETRDKVDRRIAEYRSIELLKKGGSLMIFPEGAANIEPSAPVMHMLSGAVRMARRTGKDIVPVAVECYDDKYYINIGSKIHITPLSDDKKMTEQLRDILSTLKWHIWENQGVFRRSSIRTMTDEEFALSIVKRVEWEGATLKDIYETRYHVKNEMELEKKIFE